MIGAQIVPVVWLQLLAQSENLLPEPELPLIFALTADTTGRDNCGVRQARPHSPCGLTQSMKTFQP